MCKNRMMKSWQIFGWSSILLNFSSAKVSRHTVNKNFVAHLVYYSC